jgi:Ca2+-binding EF-hand superfamily protein
MSERIYRLLLALYPSCFREEYGASAAVLFRDCLRAERGLVARIRLWIGVICDVAASLPVEYRRQSLPASEAPVAQTDGLVFYQCDSEIPTFSALINGAAVSIAVLAGLVLFMSGSAESWLFGSHHPSPSHILAARATAIPKTELDAEVKVKTAPFEPPISPYFKLILVLGALDTDRDNIISAAEIDNAPNALWMLDKNHDGKLSAEECGQRLGANAPRMDAATLRNVQLLFMRFHPVLAALDADHDGEISANEIRNAAVALRSLDQNHDGKLTEDELLPQLNRPE